MRKSGILLLLSLTLAAEAHADQYSLIGSSAESVAQGGALTAGSAGASGAFYNPATVGKNKLQESEFSYIWAKPVLSIDRERHSETAEYIQAGPIRDEEDTRYAEKLSTYHLIRYQNQVNNLQEDRAENVPLIRGFNIGFVMPLARRDRGPNGELVPAPAFLKRPFTLGVLVYVPQGPILRQRVNAPETPYFVEFDDRSQRLVANAAVSYDVLENLRLGAGVSMLADVNASLSVFVPVQLQIESLISEMGLPAVTITPLAEIEIPPVLAPTAGLQWEPTEWLSLGASYRHQIKTEVNADANISVSTGLARPTAIPAEIQSSAAFTPTQVAGGAQVSLLDKRLRLSADATWSEWSEYRPPVAEFRISNIRRLVNDIIEGSGAEQFAEELTINFEGVEVPLGDILALLRKDVPNSIHQYYEFEGFEDTVTPRFGAAFDVNDKWTLMAGYYYRPSIISDDGLKMTRITTTDFGLDAQGNRNVVVERDVINHNTLDNDQHGFSLGTKFRWDNITFGATALFIDLVEQTVDKTADDDLIPDDEADYNDAPGTQTTQWGYPGYTYGGHIVGGMVQLGYEF